MSSITKQILLGKKEKKYMERGKKDHERLKRWEEKIIQKKAFKKNNKLIKFSFNVQLEHQSNSKRREVDFVNGRPDLPSPLHDFVLARHLRRSSSCPCWFIGR